jgi:hypothetical protein
MIEEIDFLYNKIIKYDTYNKLELNTKFLKLLEEYNYDILNYLFMKIHNFIIDFDKYKKK